MLTHPRCTNCHPAGDSPRQGDTPHPHQPLVTRGADGHGAAAMRCHTCHQKANFEPGRIPGHPEWHLAPREMAWEGKSISEICEQIRDPARNGGRKVEDLIDHIGKDTLVGWAWKPGFGRSPVPGTQAQAGALVGGVGEDGSRVSGAVMAHDGMLRAHQLRFPRGRESFLVVVNRYDPAATSIAGP